jgi:hypothetical protein
MVHQLDRSIERLSPIVGRWATRGAVLGDPAIPVEGFDTYEMLAGGFFVVHHVDVAVGEARVQAVEVIGEPDPDGHGLLARSFDNSGNAETMLMHIVDDGVFRFVGGPDVAPVARRSHRRAASVRSTLAVGAGGTSMTALWERLEDVGGWQPWMEIKFTLT